MGLHRMSWQRPANLHSGSEGLMSPHWGSHHLTMLPYRVKVTNTHSGLLEREARKKSLPLNRLLSGKQGASSLVLTGSWWASLPWPQQVHAENLHSRGSLDECVPIGSDA